MKISSIVEAFKHGLVMHKIVRRLNSFGIKVDPYYLVREGDFYGKDGWDEQFTDYEVCLLGQEDMKDIVAISDWDNDAGLRNRLNKKHICLSLKLDSQIAAYTWASLEKCDHEPCQFRLKQNEAYFYDAYTLPGFRGKGLAPYMRWQCYEYLRNQNRDTFYSISDYYNDSSIRFKQKLNAKFEALYLNIVIGKSFGNWNITLRRYS